MYCIKCGNELPENSKFCNACGSFQQEKNDVTTDFKAFQTQQKQKNNKDNRKHKKIGCLVIVALLIWFIFVFLFVSLNEEPENSENNSNSYSVSETTAEQIIEISASNLIKAYQENEIKASEMYKDRYLKVTGYVDQLSRTDNTFIGDGYYVYIDYGNSYDFNTISCMLREEYVDDAANLKQGDKITIIGRCAGFSGIYVDMYDCEIVK